MRRLQLIIVKLFPLFSSSWERFPSFFSFRKESNTHSLALLHHLLHIFCSMALVSSTRSRRPTSRIESMCIHNRVDEEERWIPIIIKKGSWITMQQNKRRKLNPTMSHYINAWKGRVKEFKLDAGKKMVLVQHIYMHKDLHLHRNTTLPRHRPKCKFF